MSDQENYNQPDGITPDGASQVDPSTNDQLGESNAVPEKFYGKSYGDIAQAYSEVEKHAGKLSSELGQERKRAEELEERLKTLEARFSQPQYPQQPQVPHQPPAPETDPYDSFDELWEDDPKAALKQMLRRQEQLTQQNYQQLAQQQNIQSANEYYMRNKTENPDYARREKSMQQLLLQYKDAFKDLNSRQTYEIVDLMSQGADRKFYEDTALKKAQEQKQSLVDEKRSAYTESPYSEGEQSPLDVDNMPLEELRKHLMTPDDV